MTMASILYPSFKEGLMNKLYDLNTDTIKVALCSDAQNAADTDITDKTVLGTAVTLAGCSITGGVFDTTDAATTFSAVAAGSTVVTAEIYHDTTGDLIASIDVTDTLTNNGDIVITWDNGASKIFAL
jgi:hypothetical protein